MPNSIAGSPPRSSFGSSSSYLLSPSVSNSNFGRYFSRSNNWSIRLKHEEEYMYTDERNFVGWYSPFFFINWCIFLVVPLAYTYIGLVVLRELCRQFPTTIYKPIQDYTPVIGNLVHIAMNYSVLRFVEIWCYIEAVFYIGLKLQIKFLNSCDPLETSLAAAPLMDEDQRRTLWNRMMSVEGSHPISFISGWFFDEPIENISKYDIRDFLAWSMFEGRHQEHLTVSELRQLEAFVRDLEECITVELYGNIDNNQNSKSEPEKDDSVPSINETGVHIEDDTDFADTRESESDDEDTAVTINEPLKAMNASVAVKKTTSMNNVTNGSCSDIEDEVQTVPSSSASSEASTRKLEFRFREEIQHEEPSFFSDLFESYRAAFMTNMANNVATVGNMVNHAANEVGDLVNTVAPVQELRNMVNQAGDLMSSVAPVQELRNMVSQAANVTPVQELRNMVNNAANEMGEFHPVQELRNFMAETGKHLGKAEESAKATASQMFETLIPSGSTMDKRLAAMSHATYTQLMDAWNSVKNIRERLEMAHFLSKQRQRLRQQLKGYRIMLNQMREVAAAVPSKQMAHMMRRISECNERMDILEGKARAAFVSSTGFTLKNIPGFGRHEPQRYAKFSSDPLLGVATYPLGFHLLVLGCSEVPLRVMMKKRGFERTSIGSINYYFHPGTNDTHGGDESDDDDLCSNSSFSSTDNNRDNDNNDDRLLPLVFVHGIGLGLIPYMPLIDNCLKSGRPIFLPEIPYISGFRPWQNPNSVLQPAVVTSTMTAMLATHGYIRATWLGHSYGTAWLSYMCQFAPSTVAAVVFLDPICFGLHIPFLAKQFVYARPDPGRISYIVRTDVIVNWTIQRSFPWAWIILFLEQIGDRPCRIYLSENDALVPAERVKQYFHDNKVPITYYCSRQNKPLNRVEVDESTNEDECSLMDETDGNINDDVTVSNRHGSRDDRGTKKRVANANHSIHCFVFKSDGHGDWTDRSASLSASIAETAVDLCYEVEERDRQRRADAAATTLAKHFSSQ